MNYIELSQISKVYGSGDQLTPVLRDINFTLKKGEAAVVVGASGAGKSTLLNIMGSLDKPTSGSVFVNGENIFTKKESALCEYRNREVGFIFQFHHLLADFTALENVMMPLLIRKTSWKKAQNSAKDLLSRVDLSHRLEHKPHELSGGEQQRVALARALVGTPSLVLADEPTGNLDAHSGEKVFDLLLQLNKELGITLVVVTHNENWVHRFDKIIPITDGTVKI